MMPLGDWLYINLFHYMTISIEAGERTCGMSADVPRYGLEIHSVSSAMVDELIFHNKLSEIEDLLLFSVRFFANQEKNITSVDHLIFGKQAVKFVKKG